MANGAGRIFNIVKSTAEDISNIGSQYVTLDVISLNPLEFKLGDKLTITADFYELSKNFNIDALTIGAKVNALVLNDSQLFYILPNINITDVVGNNYLKTEMQIGTWADGKPLYRRTFDIPSTDILQNSSTIINLLSGSTIEPKMIYGMIGFQTSNVYYPIIGAANRDSVGYGVRWFNSQGLQIIIDKIMYPERKVIGGNLVIEYTKTTD